MSRTGSSGEKHRIQGTDNLLMQTIKDQASDIEHGWREAIQNGIDSPGSTRVELEYDHHHTVVRDDGDGVDLDAEFGTNLLTNLGETTKKDDDSTIGQFGIGKGQIIAKARTMMASGDTALLFDIEEWGLEVYEYPVMDVADIVRDEGHSEWAELIEDEVDGHVDGFLIVMDHYQDEVPYDGSYRWNVYEDRLEERFCYTELAKDVEIHLNDERISDEEITTGQTRESHFELYESPTTGPVHIGVRHGSRSGIDVYSNGIRVKEVDGHGISGTIVTEENLDLNFARNDIKSGCERFSEIQERLDEIRSDLFTSITGKRLNRDARNFIAEKIISEGEEERFKHVPIFQTATEGMVSYEELQELDRVGQAEKGDKASDALDETLGVVTLNKNDNASEKFLEELEESDDMEMETFEPDELASSMGIHTTHEELPMSVLSPTERKKLNVARLLAKRMETEEITQYPNRQVNYGKSDIAKQWTDGVEEIVITETTTTSNAWAEYVPEIYRALCHEFAHVHGTEDGCPDHGIEFNERYRKLVDKNMDVLTETIREIRQDGLDQVAMSAPKY